MTLLLVLLVAAFRDQEAEIIRFFTIHETAPCRARNGKFSCRHGARRGSTRTGQDGTEIGTGSVSTERKWTRARVYPPSIQWTSTLFASDHELRLVSVNICPHKTSFFYRKRP